MQLSRGNAVFIFVFTLGAALLHIHVKFQRNDWVVSRPPPKPKVSHTTMMVTQNITAKSNEKNMTNSTEVGKRSSPSDDGHIYLGSSGNISKPINRNKLPSVKTQTATNVTKESEAAPVGRSGTIPSVTGTSNETKTTNGCSWPKQSEQHCPFNETEVLNMRQHILKFFNPETNLTITKSNLHIGQLLKYEFRVRNKSNSFKVTKDFLKLIPNGSPLKERHFNTCAVVGNSGILRNSCCGQEIDSMDFVIRCNLPQIEGYEKDVGSKANFTTMNPSVVSHNFGQWRNKTKDDYDRLLRRLKQVGDQILYVPALTIAFGEEYVRIITQVVLQHKLPMKTAFQPAGLNNLIKKIWTNPGLKISGLRPSTGVHMYTMAATICDQIHLYGFYPFTKDKRGRALRYHYYGTMVKQFNKEAHNMPEEFRVFQQLHRRGAVVLHSETCN